MISNRMPRERKVYDRGFAAGVIQGNYLVVQSAGMYRDVVFRSEAGAEQFAEWTRGLLSMPEHRDAVVVRRVRRIGHAVFQLV